MVNDGENIPSSWITKIIGLSMIYLSPNNIKIGKSFLNNVAFQGILFSNNRKITKNKWNYLNYWFFNFGKKKVKPLENFNVERGEEPRNSFVRIARWCMKIRLFCRARAVCKESCSLLVKRFNVPFTYATTNVFIAGNNRHFTFEFHVLLSFSKQLASCHVTFFYSIIANQSK